MSESEGAVKRARWVEPSVDDPAAFAAAHPETVVTAELLARLEPYIRHRAREIDNRSVAEVQEELHNAIALRIIEAARASREIDDEGKAVYDYLAQAPSYIVWHAAGQVDTAVRRQRRAEKRATPFDAPLETEDGGGIEREAADTGFVGMTDRIEAQELIDLILERLTPSQRRVLGLLLAGFEREAIGDELRISRQTVHNHIQAIRRAAIAAKRDADGELGDITERRAFRTSPLIAALG